MSTKRTADVYLLRNGHEYALFMLYEQKGYYALSIVSSYGGFACAWTHPGKSFRDFLCGLNCSYVMGKMVQEPDEFDSARTITCVQEALIESRRNGRCGREDVRTDWDKLPSDFNSAYDFREWAEDSITMPSDWYEYARYSGGPRSRDFADMYDLFWAKFADELRSSHHAGVDEDKATLRRRALKSDR